MKQHSSLIMLLHTTRSFEMMSISWNNIMIRRLANECNVAYSVCTKKKGIHVRVKSFMVVVKIGWFGDQDRLSRINSEDSVKYIRGFNYSIKSIRKNRLFEYKILPRDDATDSINHSF